MRKPLSRRCGFGENKASGLAGHQFYHSALRRLSRRGAFVSSFPFLVFIFSSPRPPVFVGIAIIATVRVARLFFRRGWAFQAAQRFRRRFAFRSALQLLPLAFFKRMCLAFRGLLQLFLLPIQNLPAEPTACASAAHRNGPRDLAGLDTLADLRKPQPEIFGPLREPVEIIWV